MNKVYNFTAKSIYIHAHYEKTPNAVPGRKLSEK